MRRDKEVTLRALKKFCGIPTKNVSARNKAVNGYIHSYETRVSKRDFSRISMNRFGASGLQSKIGQSDE